MSLTYEAMKGPDQRKWLAHSEGERIEAVEAYRRKHGVRVPNPFLHATIHVVVENQVALGDETPVEQTLVRLMKEGLARHEAIHAIGAVLASHLDDLLKTPARRSQPIAAIDCN